MRRPKKRYIKSVARSHSYQACAGRERRQRDHLRKINRRHAALLKKRQKRILAREKRKLKRKHRWV